MKVLRDEDMKTDQQLPHDATLWSVRKHDEIQMNRDRRQIPQWNTIQIYAEPIGC